MISDLNPIRMMFEGIETRILVILSFYYFNYHETVVRESSDECEILKSIEPESTFQTQTWQIESV